MRASSSLRCDGFDELRDVACDARWMETAPDIEVYYMYRDLYHTREHKDTIVEHQLRYDITIIPSPQDGD